MSKSSNIRGRAQCKGKTKAGGTCRAPAVEAGLCFCHAHPERLSELGRQGGRKNRRRTLDNGDMPNRPLKTLEQVGELLEETINRVRESPFDLRAANSIGFLASILLKTIDQRMEERLAHLEAVMIGNRETVQEAFDFRSAKEQINGKSRTTPQEN